MPEAAIPLVAEEAVGTTAAELAAQQAAQMAAEQQAAAALEAQQAAEAAQATQQATNEAIRNTVTQTPVSGSGSGGISNLVNTTGGPTTWEQIFSQGQNLAEGSTELGKLASTASELPALPEAATAGPAIPPSAPVQNAPLPQVGTPPAAPPPATPPAIPPVEPPPVPPSPDAATQISRLQSMGAEAPPEPASYLKSTTPFQYPSVPTMPANPATMGLGGTDAGIQTLAKEVGAQTSAPGINQLVQPNLASAGANLPPVTNAPVPIEQDPYNFINNPKVNPESSSFNGPRPEDTLDRQFREAGITSAPITSPPAAPPIEQGGQSLYGPNGIATGNPNPPPNTPTDVTYGAGQSRITTNPADLLNQPSPASDAMAGIKGLWKDFKDMPLKDKALTGLMASSAYQMLNQPKPYEKPKYKSTWNAGAYSGFNPTPPTPYQPQYAQGGLADLGGYSDGGRMLKGPGDGMSDDIPATIANKQPARLANEEFVIPADVVSHLGNGSSEAGAKVLYKMMDRVRQARTGSKKQGKQINPEKYLA